VQLKVCLNGGRQPTEHPAVPRTPTELATAARDAVRAGAEAVHLHPRAAEGNESLLAADIGAAVAAVRKACPGVPVGVSTGLWITAGDVAGRQSQVTDWAALDRWRRPDFASVNLSEPGSVDLLTALADAGVGAEAGVWSVADAQALADTLDRGVTWLRVLVEILNAPADHAADAADQVLAAVVAAILETGPRSPDGQLPVLLHGEGAACWPLVQHAARLGLATRIGLEDTVIGPASETPRDNAHLVELAVSLRKTHGGYGVQDTSA